MFWVGWFLLSGFALLLCPYLIGDAESLWKPGGSSVILAHVMTHFFASFTLLSVFLWRKTLQVSDIVGTIGVALAAMYFALLMVPVVNYSRAVLFGGTAVLVLSYVAAAIWARTRASLSILIGLTLSLALLFPTASILASIDQDAALGEENPPITRSELISSSHHTLRATYYDELIATDEMRPAAIAAIDSDYLLVTGAGRLYLIRPVRERDSLGVTELDLRVPINREAFVRAVGEGVDTRLFRATDMLVETRRDSVRILVSHQYWISSRECFVLRVSAATTSREMFPGFGAEPGWRTLYETTPCLNLKSGERGLVFAGHQSGGRLASLREGEFLLTVGDFEFDGWNADRMLSQDSTSDYGKVLSIGSGQGSRLYSKGHRNPQGLHIDAEGRIWSTEHGPEGGDELNLIFEGGNYGWPLTTYGTEYAMDKWPAASPDPRGFTEPVFAWIPSIGVSNLISVSGSLFERWQGDLLVASLRAKTLFRVKTIEGRVVYVEPIALDGRIRDLAEGPTGQILLVLDRGTLVLMSKADLDTSGAAIFARQCSGCHQVANESESGIGPDLEGLYERSIAGDGEFEYSETLREMPGIWTASRLDEFLANPEAFAPSNNMSWSATLSVEERRALIAYLRSL